LKKHQTEMRQTGHRKTSFESVRDWEEHDLPALSGIWPGGGAIAALSFAHLAFCTQKKSGLFTYRSWLNLEISIWSCCRIPKGLDMKIYEEQKCWGSRRGFDSHWIFG
jgi:hypothetical protein